VVRVEVRITGLYVGDDTVVVVDIMYSFVVRKCQCFCKFLGEI